MLGLGTERGGFTDWVDGPIIQIIAKGLKGFHLHMLFPG